MADPQIPTFNLKVVLNQTGLKADTLRAWERRYGLPKPKRSPGKHRLYSQRDIDTIKWLVARQDEGMSISNAVELWQNIEASGSDPLLSAEFASPAGAAVPLPAAGGRGLDELRTMWLTACGAFDEAASARILSEAFSLYAVEDVCLHLILDGMRQIGQEWYQGDLAVEQEHFASAIARRQLHAIVSAAPAPTRSEKIFVGAAPGEMHDLVLLMIALILRRRGWDVIFLGANVPLESYRSVLDPARFTLAIVSAEQLFTAASLRDVALIAHNAGFPFLFGGRIFQQIPDLQNRIPGRYLGDQLDAIPGLVANTLTSPSPPDSIADLDQRYQDALADFEKQSLRIELAVQQRISTQMPDDSLAIANLNFSRDIQAALALGDLNVLDQELDWLRGLIENHGLPPALLAGYLDAYTQAAQEYLVADGQLVVSWLKQLDLPA